MAWFVYELPPIDFGWSNLKTVEETAADIAKMQFALQAKGIPADLADTPTVEEFLSDWENAKSEASHLGWDGDFREDPAVFWMPAEERFVFGFVIKQDNNGTTYVISPVELLHLNDLV